MADYRRSKFERRMKAYRDHLKKKKQDSTEVEDEKKQINEEDRQRLIELWKKSSKKDVPVVR